MLSKREEERRNQLEVVALDELVPEDHYSSDNGRPSVDPVVLIKMVLIQYLFGIRSMRQTIKEIETNVAYRWFIGYGFSEKIPHFSTFGKNYVRRFHDTDLFEQIFYR
ncbi:transposase, partial [Bacillus sp. FJAT-53060]